MCKPEGVYRARRSHGPVHHCLPQAGYDHCHHGNSGRSCHWAQNTLDLTWDFLEKIGDGDLAENQQAYGELTQKLARLNVPNPAYHPYSPKMGQIDGKTYKVTSGFLSPEMENFMGKSHVIQVSQCSFDFDNYGCVWNVTTPEGEQVPPSEWPHMEAGSPIWSRPRKIRPSFW